MLIIIFLEDINDKKENLKFSDLKLIFKDLNLCLIREDIL